MLFYLSSLQFAVEAFTAIIVDGVLVSISKLYQILVHRVILDLSLLDNLPKTVVNRSYTPSLISIQFRQRYYADVLGLNQHHRYTDCAI